MKFLVDHQLPPVLARFLASRGLESLHVSDIGLKEAKDPAIWKYATTNRFVLITKDEDFIDIASRSPEGQVVWVRLGNCRKSELLQAFERVWEPLLAILDRGDHVVEIR